MIAIGSPLRRTLVVVRRSRCEASSIESVTGSRSEPMPTTCQHRWPAIVSSPTTLASMMAARPLAMPLRSICGTVDETRDEMPAAEESATSRLRASWAFFCGHAL